AGQPVAGAVVRWRMNRSRWSEQLVHTDAQGKYVFRDVPHDLGFVLVTSEGFAPQLAEVPLQQQEIDIRLAPGQTAVGFVGKTDGAPLAEVLVEPKIGPWRLSELAVRSDAQGNYVLPQMPAQFDLNFHSTGLEYATKHVRLADGVPDTILKA